MYIAIDDQLKCCGIKKIAGGSWDIKEIERAIEVSNLFFLSFKIFNDNKYFYRWLSKLQ